MSVHSDPGGESARPALPTLEPDVHDLLSTLYARAMLCEARWRGLGSELETGHDCSAAQRADRERRHAELAHELTALREQIDRVRRAADPAGTFL